ncbi:MAG: S-layer homology domain-containing protein [Anaerovoracaceae bacterium]
MRTREGFSKKRMAVLTALSLCAAMLFTQVFCYAAYNSVPTKQYPKVTGVEVVESTAENADGEAWQAEVHIKFSNNVGAIDEEQERNAVNETDPDYMIGVNERNLTKFHLIDPVTEKEIAEEDWEVSPHPDAEKHTDESKYFYIYVKNLDESKDYQVKIDEDLFANMGNSLGAPYIVTFNLGSKTGNYETEGDLPADEHVQAPLTLDLANIENGEKDVPVGKKINMRFSFNVAGDEVFEYNKKQISIVKSADESQSVEIEVLPGGELQELTVILAENLEYGTEYKLVINKEFMARNGIALSSPINIYFTTVENPDGSGNEGGGGSGSGDVTEKPEETQGELTIASMKNGSVAVDPQEPKAGEKVLITVTPDEGYLLKSLRVTDEEGGEIELTEDSNGKYNFIMPEGKAKLEVVFEEDKPVENYYSDIASNWAAEDINLLADLGVVTGKPDGTFRPDSEITRAEIVAILVRLYDLNSDDMVLFDDTKDHWASGYISIAASLGYVNGFDAKHFGPDDQLTREQMAVMTARIAELQEDTSGGNPVPFTDKDRISSWALSAVTSVFQNGVISGYPDGTFRPSAKITRAEACHMIVNLINLQQEAA